MLHTLNTYISMFKMFLDSYIDHLKNRLKVSSPLQEWINIIFRNLGIQKVFSSKTFYGLLKID